MMMMMPRTTPSALAAAAAALTLALGACTVIPERPERPGIWDLGAPPALQTSARPGAALALSRIRAAAALDGDAIHYRLLYEDGGDKQPRPYAHSRWSMSVPQLLGQRITQRLAASRPVLDAASGGHLAALDLRLELDEFAQHFSSAEESAGVIRLRATLFAGQPRRLLAQRSFAASHPAPTPDAAGGVQALRAAADALASELDAWLRHYDAASAEQVRSN